MHHAFASVQHQQMDELQIFFGRDDFDKLQNNSE